MIDQRPVREAPYPCLLDRDSPCRPEVSEPVLKVADIQGNVLAGFNKDFQILLFLEIVEPEPFKAWLKKDLVPFVASTWEVLTFNRLFKEVRGRRGDSRALRSTWLNVAFSHRGLTKLAPSEEVGMFRDEAFQNGLCARSKELGDPQKGDGSRDTWIVGGPENEPDVVLIFASDLECDLLAEVDRIERSLLAAGLRNGGGTAARIVYKEQGAVLPPPLRGHEHFGFLDGISQPGLRGRISEDSRDVLTLREDPRSSNHGKPGQDLLWPGEFVFGYSGQDPQDADKEGPNSLGLNGDRVAPEWAKDGSYLVVRRLRQDVPAFREFVAGTAAKLGLSPDILAAKMVGRFPSGAPILRTPYEDPELGANECANNHFEFASEPDEDEDEHAIAATASEHQCPILPPAEPDDEGKVCPFSGHIRKVYPRNDRDRFVPDNGEADAQKHRLIRRGIPFGPPYPANPLPGGEEGSERGLLFLSYQTSIVNQFEHVQKRFANNIERDPKTGEMRAGFDPIIGQNAGKPRSFVMPLERNGRVKRHVIEAPRQWVLPTGGGYFFSPSISALEKNLAAKVEKEDGLGDAPERKPKAAPLKQGAKAAR